MYMKVIDKGVFLLKCVSCETHRLFFCTLGCFDAQEVTGNSGKHGLRIFAQGLRINETFWKSIEMMSYRSK